MDGEQLQGGVGDVLTGLQRLFLPRFVDPRTAP